MGNQTSTQFSRDNNNQKDNDKLSPKPISQILDYIATYYILTMDFNSLRKLYDKEYCDKLVILTSDIINIYFTDLEVTYLAQRIKNGVEINEVEKDKVVFFNKDDIDKLNIQNSIKKNRICMSISKFYIKIAHIFAAIVTTVNPIYVYKDTEGNNVRASLYEKGKIPKNTPRQIYKLNICDNRINALKNKNSLEPDINGEFLVGPKVCNVNIGKDKTSKTLKDEPGIPELEDLYYDDNYDFKTGKFIGMSDKTKKIFKSDLEIFYNIFTGNSIMPPEITKFSDIKLRDYHNMDECKNSEPLFERKYKGPLTNQLFKNYAENLKKMIQTANKNQQALLQIINQLFVYIIDAQTNKKQIRINPTLTEEKLQKIVIETRELIIKLYLSCEIDYVNGLKMYEAIIEQKILETSQNQINNLSEISDKLIIEDNIKSKEPEILKETDIPKETEIVSQVKL